MLVIRRLPLLILRHGSLAPFGIQKLVGNKKRERERERARERKKRETGHKVPSHFHYDSPARECFSKYSEVSVSSCVLEMCLMEREVKWSNKRVLKKNAGGGIKNQNHRKDRKLFMIAHFSFSRLKSQFKRKSFKIYFQQFHDQIMA